LPALSRAREAANRAACQNNLKQFGIMFKMYAGEAKGKFPPVQCTIDAEHEWDSSLGRYVPNGDLSLIFAACPSISAIYPEYLTDPAVLICPSDPGETVDDLKGPDGQFNIHQPLSDGQEGKKAGDASYGYWGWVFDKCGDNDPQVPLGQLAIALGGSAEDAALPAPRQFVEALTGLVLALNEDPPNVARADGDLDVTAGFGNGGGNKILRLKEGIERFAITDINNPAGSAMAQSTLWIMSDAISTEVDNYNHVPGGSNVLYMDGHVEFIKYPGKQPISRLFANAVGGLFN
jgi:prepilin-type processing-associated H-X9-DG protein